MDAGDGSFKLFQAEGTDELKRIEEKLHKKYPDHGGTFMIGEELEIRGSIFKIRAIDPKGNMRLKLKKK